MPGLPLSYQLYRLVWSALDLLFPPLCGGCSRPGSRWCSDCQKRVPVLGELICEVCGLPQSVPGVCAACRRERPPFRALRSWSAFDAPVKHALHRLKYRRDIALGDVLAAQLSGYVKTLEWPVEVVVPVPLGKQRLKERGYNQVGLIARPLALELRLSYVPHALSRARETRSQVGLTKMERQDNVRGAFRAEGERVNGRVVLLIDDVATTGSTLSSGADALLSAGARDVYALTIARALPQHGLSSV